MEILECHRTHFQSIRVFEFFLMFRSESGNDVPVVHVLPFTQEQSTLLIDEIPEVESERNPKDI